MKRKLLPTAMMYRESVANSYGLLRTMGELEPCIDYDGQIVSFCGAWAVVFKVRFCDDRDDENTKFYALKCYLKHGDNSKAAAAMLAGLESDYIVHFQYLEDELYVYNQNGEGSYFPVSVMEWVEGETLGHAVMRFCRPINRKGDFDSDYLADLGVLASNFDRFALWLLDQPFAHGDLKDDNILVDEQLNIRVIDYDNIYIPDSGEAAKMVFSPDYQHPSRTAETRGLFLDDYSLALISLSLHALAERPELYAALHRGDKLIFDPAVISPEASAVLPEASAVLPDVSATSASGRDHFHSQKLKDHAAAQLAALDELHEMWLARGEGSKVALIDALRSQNLQIEGLKSVFSGLKV